MQATNDSLRFMQGDTEFRKVTFHGQAVQQKPKKVEETYDLPDEETMRKCEQMAEQLKAKYPHMKPARIARKVAEYYKLNKRN